MNETIDYIGNYRFKAGNHRHREPYWASKVVFKNYEEHVVDAAGKDDEGKDFVRLLPYKKRADCPQIDEILRDGDLLAYVMEPKTIDIPSDFSNIDAKTLGALGDVLKGRASHAELGYRNEANQAMQVSLWEHSGPTYPDDRRFSIHTDSDTINIYRVSLSGYNVDTRTETLLKAEVKRWKEMVKPVEFPCGRKMNVDPVDFTTMEELRKIAESCINHAPDNTTPLFNFKLNCVQWSALVFSLAVCFPLSERMLRETGLWEGYKTNWAGKLGCAAEDLVGIGELPIPFYTMEEIVENTLEMYLPEQKSKLLAALDKLPLQQLLGGLGDLDSKRVMPNAFVVENRLRGRGVERRTKSVFRYVATAAPEDELERISQPGKDSSP